ncbi:MOSC domain-containing protein [Dissulfurirhabdus thermomarina]|uniref:MOSC domain-containing protein n=2 Tax=Dissulfurirhabdus thermomarina TaxID=1765737 RepID=A0A6N9TS62_DISTH|nr:MOSC domain-containing protein [Dissulfurirhabdus thermomarina]NMX23786.1 MOSC domain-containing protein [Dissulfurirhabdus thermomarina]
MDNTSGGGRVVSIAWSERKGERKTRVERAVLVAGHGLEGDAHAGPWHRQVSLLAAEGISRARERGLDVHFGDFAENVATEGIDWPAVAVGTRVRIGAEVEIEITQIGKRCHTRCAIYHMAGDCIMPREGVFGRVLRGGEIRVGDAVRLLSGEAGE